MGEGWMEEWHPVVMAIGGLVMAIDVGWQGTRHG